VARTERGRTMPEIKVNGAQMSCPPGKRLLDFLTEQGVVVPHYCWHPGLPPHGNCRMCLVKVSTSRKLEVSCMIMPSEGMEVWTEGPEVDKGRESVLEYMLINHPLDCPICDKAGECKLQDHTYDYRHGLSRFQESKVIKHTKDLGPNIKIWGNRCISCTRCVRFCEEISGTGELTIAYRGDHSVADTHPSIPLDNPMSLNTVDICPVGALIDKNFLYQARVWFAKRTDSICTGCSRGCNVTGTVYKGELKRLQPRHNDAVNGYWMCDAGRLGIGHIRSDRRLKQGKGTIRALAEGLKAARGKVAILGSTSHTLEEMYLLRQLADATAGRLAFLTKEAGERWVSKSGFVIETDKTSNRTGALAMFGQLKGEDEIIRAIDAGEVTALLVTNQIPELQFSERLLTAARKVSFLAVADLLDSPLSAAAQVVIPAACWAEKDGAIMNRDGRIQRLQVLVPPPGGATPDVAWLQDVLVALGARPTAISAEGVFKSAWPGLDYGQVGPLGKVPGEAGSASREPAVALENK
jgi:NADH-quinone oxidoreductase subunit G